MHCVRTSGCLCFLIWGSVSGGTGRTALSSPYSSLSRTPLYFGLVLEARSQPTNLVSIITIPAYWGLVLFSLTYLPSLTHLHSWRWGEKRKERWAEERGRLSSGRVEDSCGAEVQERKRAREESERDGEGSGDGEERCARSGWERGGRNGWKEANTGSGRDKKERNQCKGVKK